MKFICNTDTICNKAYKGEEGMKTKFLGNKKVVKLLISAVLLMVLCILPRTELQAAEEFVIEDGVLVKYNGESKIIEIPKGVVKITSSAFPNVVKAETLIIPEGVVEIEEYTFAEWNYLKTVELPNSLTVIPSRLFEGCDNLATIDIPDTVTVIESSAFWNCAKLKKVTLPKNLKKIENFAFADCTSLTEIVIPSKVKSMGNNVFSGCTSLKKITIPKSVEEFGADIFKGTPWLKEKIKMNPYVQVNKVLIDVSGVKGNTITVPKGVEKTVILPLNSSVTTIKYPGTVKKVIGCSSENVTTIILEEGIEEIGDGAFNACRALKNITIPSSVKIIGNKAFFLCDSLEKITIKNGVKSIGDEAFNCCRKLKEITLPTTVTKLGKSVFDDCTALEKVVINGKIATIPELAFFNCTALKTVSFKANTVKKIGDSAFRNCYNLTKVSFAKNVTEIGKSAFAGCTGLKEINAGSKLKTIGEFGFAACFALEKFPVTDKLVSVGDAAFYECKSLKNFKLPDSVENIGFMALHGCGKSLITKGKGSKGYAGTYKIWDQDFPKLQYFAYDCAIEDNERYGADDRYVTTYADAMKKLSDSMKAYILENSEYKFSGMPGLYVVGNYYMSWFGITMAQTNLYTVAMNKDETFDEAGYFIQFGDYSLVPASMSRIVMNESLKAFCAGISSTPDKLYYALYSAWMNDNNEKINSKSWVIVGDCKVRCNEEGNRFYIIEK